MKKKSVDSAVKPEEHAPASGIDLQGSLADLIYDLLDLEGEDKPPQVDATAAAPVWYLGLDIGTTGLSAVLLNRTQRQLYPIYWTRSQPSTTGLGDRRFRLPFVATLSLEASAPEAGNQHSAAHTQPWQIPLPPEMLLPPVAALTSDAPTFQIHSLKPYLRLGIPDADLPLERQKLLIQWSDHWQVPLLWLRQVLQTALSSLVMPPSDLPVSGDNLICGALELEPHALRSALSQLAGIVVSSPITGSELYRFNLRQAILQLGLVAEPAQISFIEEPIAALLSLLRQEVATPVLERQGISEKLAKENLVEENLVEENLAKENLAKENLAKENAVLDRLDWQGKTLILSAGATLTELAIVQLPAQIEALSHADFHSRSLSYAGNSIDQDIVCQILIPLLQQPISADTRLDRGEQAHLRLNPVHLERLGLPSLTLPIPGEPDLLARYRLHQRLESCQSGQILQNAAHYLKLALQQQNQFMLQLGDRVGTILRQDLGSKVILPYVQKLNRELNLLLKQTQTPVSSVNQILCTGGTASIAAIARWLRQKFPNATILQDTYTRPIALQEHSFASCSRIAYGLAILPLYAQSLNSAPPQHSDPLLHSDYDLLAVLLQQFPDHPIMLDEALDLVRQQGIDSIACRSRLLALLEGYLPPGLISTEAEAVLFAPASLTRSNGQIISAAPLFTKQDDRYAVNPEQQTIVLHALETLLSIAPLHFSFNPVSSLVTKIDL